MLRYKGKSDTSTFPVKPWKRVKLSIMHNDHPEIEVALRIFCKM